MKNPIPELYAYILRNIIRTSNYHTTTSNKIFKSMKKVIYKSPMCVFREIIREFSEDYHVLVKLNKTHFRIQISEKVKRQLEKLNKSIFPIRV